MNIKTILTYLLIALLLYWGIGLLMIRLGVIKQLYLYPGKSIKQVQKSVEKSDTSTMGADGPIIIRNGDTLTGYSILPHDSSYRLEVSTIHKTDTLSCYIPASNQRFSFRLRDSIITEPDTYPLPNKLLALSDIEGNFQRLYNILNGTGIIDQQMNWTFGNGHLVLNGDVLDRGLNVTECLWLIYKLEQEAEQAGGKVHFILGNHEVMNMKGHFKYVRAKYRRNADTLKLPYAYWYSNQSELGRWLRSKNTMEKIGDYLFVHGGISTKIAERQLSLQQINDIVRLKLSLPADNYIKDVNDTLLGKDGPLRYRGIVHKKISDAALDQVLLSYGVKKMIIGHTIVDEICYLYQQKVIAIDRHHDEYRKEDCIYALFITPDECSVIDHKGNRKKIPDK